MKSRRERKKEDKIITMFEGGEGYYPLGRGSIRRFREGRRSLLERFASSRAKIMGIRVKETAAVSTYLEWKASTGGGGGAGGGQERALRVLLTQMISRLDIQRGIL